MDTGLRWLDNDQQREHSPPRMWYILVARESSASPWPVIVFPAGHGSFQTRAFAVFDSFPVRALWTCFRMDTIASGREDHKVRPLVHENAENSANVAVPFFIWKAKFGKKTTAK